MGNEQKPQKKMEFTIIKDDPLDGDKGFGIGSISLENVTPVIVDVEEETAYVEIAAMHARSKLERSTKFLPTREESAEGKQYWIVWITVEYKKEGPYYAGVTACEMVVDLKKRRGYKNFADHVNKMDHSMKGRIRVDEMDDTSKRVLADFLKTHNEELWKNSTEELHEALNA